MAVVLASAQISAANATSHRLCSPIKQPITDSMQATKRWLVRILLVYWHAKFKI